MKFPFLYGKGFRGQDPAPDQPAPVAMGEDAKMDRQFRSFADFWPYYLGEHSKPATRLLHCIGTLTAIAFVIFLVAIGKWWLFPVALAPGYAFAWGAHFFVEKNRPATFTYPLWSFMGDWKMLALMLTGRLKR